MSWIKDVIVRFKGDASELKQATDVATRKLTSFGSVAKSVFPAVAGMAQTAMAAVAAFAIKGFQSYSDAAKSLVKVSQAVSQTGMAAGFTSKELQKVAKDLSKITAIDDDIIMNNVTAQLLTFTNIAGDNFKRAQIAALDLATMLGGDLKSSAIQLGKALNEPVQALLALTRSGVQFSDQQRKLIKHLAESGKLYEAQSIILDEVERQYGGQAKAMADLPVNKVEKLKVAWENIGEQLGEFVAPAIIKVSELMIKLSENVNKPYNERGWFGRFLADLDPVWHFRNLFGTAASEMEKFQSKMQQMEVPRWTDKTNWKFQGFEEGDIEKIWEEENKRIEEQNKLLQENIRKRNEIVVIATALERYEKEQAQFTAISDVADVLTQKSGLKKPKKLAPSSGTIIGEETYEDIIPAIAEMNRQLEISDALANDIIGTFQSLGDQLADGADSWEDFGKSALNALRQVVSGLIAKGVASAIEKSLSQLPVGVGLAVGAVSGGLAAGLFNTLIPSFAGGGYVSSPTMAMIGDAKDGKGEWVLNSTQMGALAGSGGGRLEVEVTGRALKFVLDRENATQSRLG